ncbi:hypothetical protein A5724_26935 [Mycobacterium sp. ACS1612]|uniref:hypothetical protein n=1 Tax=Mycobacterium sp. ACS1612 TaxID=1834117 RepID=UPI0007FBC780|nr:hypothetical protein [Mycobacterium sp. ACS1612]OBF29021.1 hypothetical protein A5724_26935 [Mycobacterium sp. ACS1612]
MELSWWPVAVVGFGCLAGAVALAVLSAKEDARRTLRPLANASRLTRLPDYARLARMRMLAMVVTVTLLSTVFCAAMLASARPTGWLWTSEGDVPQDIMLCVGEPLANTATSEFLSYYAAKVKTFGTQRIGLTSPTRRVVPLTRDYQYAAGQFGNFATAGRANAAAFAPTVSYVDYAPSIDDVLALCMTGFPSFDARSTHGRSVIYLGPSSIRAPDESRPALFVDQRVTEMAAKAGVQINVVTTSPRGREAGLRSITEATKGQFFYYDPAESTLPADLDRIGQRPPAAGLPGGATALGWRSDAPDLPLAVAVIASALLCVSLAVLRR